MLGDESLIMSFYIIQYSKENNFSPYTTLWLCV